jgi:MFS transporter, FSR family, fosmidomycin resistance protein
MTSLSSMPSAPARAAMPVLLALSFTHFLNDMIQSLIPAIYPVIKDAYRLDFAQIGIITLVFQGTASLFQPLIGAYTDKHPMPYSMVAGMGSTLAGLIVLAYATGYGMLLLGAGLVGLGSSIFHPEATRLARNASGGQQGLAQGIFQVGGQAGGSMGPLLAAFVVLHQGQTSLVWFSLAALLAMALMLWTGRWQAEFQRRRAAEPTVTAAADVAGPGLPARTVLFAMTLLVIILFSKNAYSQSFSTFYTFYLVERFQVSVQSSSAGWWVTGSDANGSSGCRSWGPCPSR